MQSRLASVKGRHFGGICLLNSDCHCQASLSLGNSFIIFYTLLINYLNLEN